MYPRKFYEHFGWRILISKLGTGTLFLWDSEKEELIDPKPYHLFQMYGGVAGGIFFVGIHIIHMHQITHPLEIDEEGVTTPFELDLTTFATIMIEAAEILLVTCVGFLNWTFLKRRDVFQFLFNELLNYNKKLAEMIESGKLTLTTEQKGILRVSLLLQYVVMVISTFLPFGVVAAIFADVEPTNRLVLAWLEVPFSLSWGFFPMIILSLISVFAVGTLVGLMMMVINFYYMTAYICTSAFVPEGVTYTPKVGPGRGTLVTRGFGTLTDIEVIYLYRVQQILNTYLNIFFKSVLVSFHHVGCLATIVVLLVFAIKYDAILKEQGFLGYFVVFSSMMAPFVMIYFQTRMAGDVVDISEEFRAAPEKILMGRKMMFRKFSKGCTTFFIQVAYPFYTIHKETFTEFCQQAQDYSMELLLS